MNFQNLKNLINLLKYKPRKITPKDTNLLYDKLNKQVLS